MKENDKNCLKLVVILFIFSYFLPIQANAQIALPPIVPTTVNTVLQPLTNTVQPVVTVVPPVVPTVVTTVNNLLKQNLPQNLPIPTVFPPANQTQGSTDSTNTSSGDTGSTMTSTYSTTGTTYNSTQSQPGNNVPVMGFLDTQNQKGVLFLNRANTANRKIVLPDDITEVIFGPDSLSHEGLLTFVMPSKKDLPILFNFNAFLHNDHILLPQAIRMEQTVNTESASVTLPANEDMTLSNSDCPDDIWDGSFTALTMLSQSSVSLPGKIIGLPLRIGKSDCKMLLSRQANITFVHQPNFHVGYNLQNQDAFKEITSLCPITNQSECYSYEGPDLAVKTYHFTQFVTFKNSTLVDALFAFIKNSLLLALGAAILVALMLVAIIKSRTTAISTQSKKKKKKKTK